MTYVVAVAFGRLSLGRFAAAVAPAQVVAISTQSSLASLPVMIERARDWPQAIAMAEGVSDLANLQGIVVFRTVDGQRMAAVFDLKQIRAGDAIDPQIYGDDIVVVDQSGAKTGLRRVLETIPVFNLFRPY